MTTAFPPRQLRCAIVTAFLAFCVLNPAPQASAAGGGKHCLWRVSNAPAPFYLLGTIHALRASDYPLPAVIDRAILQSQQFYFESDPKLSGIEAQKWKAAIYYPKRTFIKTKIRPETFKHLMKITSAGYASWQYMRPWAIAFFLLRHPGFGGVHGTYGVDEYVERIARKRNLSMFGLETPDEHVRVLADMDDHESEVFLLQALVYGGSEGSRYRECVAAWKVGDTQRIASLGYPVIQDAPNLNKRLLDWRNVKWIPKIQGAIKSGKPTMIVAGCAHFSGPNNVISLLRARGYKIEQL